MNQEQKTDSTTSLCSAFSEAEQRKIEENLYRLLQTETAAFTRGESASIPIELGEELLESIVFTLREAVTIGEISLRELPDADLNAVLAKGRQSLRYRLRAGKILWQRACRTAPKIEQISYATTLKSVGGFFSAYNLRFFAHEIPCDIDYQLCLAVDESRKGVLYINDYLLRIIRENRMVNAFSTPFVMSLNESVSPHYRELLINLCEPVLTNAVGRILIDKDPFELNMTNTDRKKLEKKLWGCPPREIAALNDIAARSLCRETGFNDDDDIAYFTAAISNLTPRLTAALNNNDLSAVFLTFL